MTTLTRTDPKREHSKLEKYLDDAMIILILPRKVFPAVTQQKEWQKSTTTLRLYKNFVIFGFYVRPVVVV